MICVSSKLLNAKAAKMPIGYMDDCKISAIFDAAHDLWCFQDSDFYRIRRKYRGYAVSEADPFREGEIISGCCDRADQY